MRIVEYTATAGGRDSKVRPPREGRHAKTCYVPGGIPVESGWDTVKEIEDDRWEAQRLRVVPEMTRLDYGDWYIWHDASIILRKDERGDPEQLVQQCIEVGAEIGLVPTPDYKLTLYDEINEIAYTAPERYGHADFDTTIMQNYYSRRPGISLKRNPYRAGVIVRKKSTAIEAFNQAWWKEIERWGIMPNQVQLTVALQICRMYDHVCELSRECFVPKGHR